MAGLVYFKPGDAPSRAFLERIEFPHTLHAGTPGRGCSAGPDGKAGFCFGLGPPAHRDGVAATVGHFPQVQTWREYVGGELWLGWETASPPRPVDLQREEAAEGVEIALADGLLWTIPVLHGLDGSPNLPCVYEWDHEFRLCRRVLPGFRELWDTLKRLAGGEPVSAEEAAAVVDYALRLNYRLCAAEAYLLGVLNAEAMERVLLATVGFNELELVEV